MKFTLQSLWPTFVYMAKLLLVGVSLNDTYKLQEVFMVAECRYEAYIQGTILDSELEAMARLPLRPD